MYLDRFRYIWIIVLKYAEQETKLVHFSPRSRDQLKAHVLIYHHLFPSPAPFLLSNAAPTKSSACCRMQYGIVPVSPNGTTGSFPRIDFHWEHVKHLVIRPAFINDAGTAGQAPLCAKHLQLE
jgi:hypothetical protein